MMSVRVACCHAAKRSVRRAQHMNLSMAAMAQEKPVETSIRKKLEDNLQPVHLEVINESYMHNVPKGSETHFKVVVVSKQFANEPLIKRHRLVNGLLHHELESGVHALAITARTPEQWDQSDKVVDKSPACKGGFGL